MLLFLLLKISLTAGPIWFSFTVKLPGKLKIRISPPFKEFFSKIYQSIIVIFLHKIEIRGLNWELLGAYPKVYLYSYLIPNNLFVTVLQTDNDKVYGNNATKLTSLTVGTPPDLGLLDLAPPGDLDLLIVPRAEFPLAASLASTYKDNEGYNNGIWCFPPMYLLSNFWITSKYWEIF